MLYEPTCEVCGHHIEDDRCEYCRATGENGDWINKVIEQARDPRHDQSAFKDKNKKPVSYTHLTLPTIYSV